MSLEPPFVGEKLLANQLINLYLFLEFEGNDPDAPVGESYSFACLRYNAYTIRTTGLKFVLFLRPR